ncbi:MAG: triose-phosphate isomerase [Candidatus Eisenbacteria bacterium]|nr:triose-phosphate isomerase [Candidatus Eisenbacteria bacterium]
MYKTGKEAAQLARSLKEGINLFQEVEIVLFPPFTALSRVSEVIVGTPLILGAQNVHWEKEGAFTGEVSPPMLVDAGCRYAIVGHSERRKFFGETDEMVNLKAKSSLAYGLKPILCVGEELEEREQNRTEQVLERQVKAAYAGIAEESVLKTVIAYEPVWAIGTGRTASPDVADETQAFIRKLIGKIYNEAISALLRIQYGGSVKPDNAKDLFREPNIDGALVGGASLKGDSFLAIVSACQAVGK